jgi:hypothetical protein
MGEAQAEAGKGGKWLGAESSAPRSPLMIINTVCEGFDAHARDKLGRGRKILLGSDEDEARAAGAAQEPEGWRMWDIIHCGRTLPPSTYLVFFFGGLTFTK